MNQSLTQSNRLNYDAAITRYIFEQNKVIFKPKGLEIF